MRTGRRGCCGTGCLLLSLLLLMALLAMGWVVAVQAGIPQRLGLIKPPEERLLGGAPNRAAGAALLAELQQAGLSSQGLEVAVLPVKGKSYYLAAVVMDASSGFRFGATTAGDPLVETFKRLASGQAASEYNIGRVALHYIDEEGRNLVSLTATTDAIQRFANGQMTRQAFLQAVEGQVDMRALLEEWLP